MTTKTQMQNESMRDRDIRRGWAHWRGHKVIMDKLSQWVFADTGEPTPSGGGKLRPCAKCGLIFDGSAIGEPDPCLGNLPGVDNACCGHGVPEDAYIRFENGVVITDFKVK